MTARIVITCNDTVDTYGSLCANKFFASTADAGEANQQAEAAGWHVRADGTHSCRKYGGSFPGDQWTGPKLKRKGRR